MPVRSRGGRPPQWIPEWFFCDYCMGITKHRWNKNPGIWKCSEPDHGMRYRLVRRVYGMPHPFVSLDIAE